MTIPEYARTNRKTRLLEAPQVLHDRTHCHYDWFEKAWCYRRQGGTACNRYPDDKSVGIVYIGQRCSGGWPAFADCTLSAPVDEQENVIPPRALRSTGGDFYRMWAVGLRFFWANPLTALCRLGREETESELKAYARPNSDRTSTHTI